MVLGTLDGSQGEPRAALAACQHIFETEVVWLRRIAGDPRPMIGLWREPSLTLTQELAAEAADRLAAIEASPGEAAAEVTFSYRNSRGHEFSDRVDEVLMHTFMHSSQYRGEAAGFLNAAGFRVPDIDLIFWTRLGEPA